MPLFKEKILSQFDNLQQAKKLMKEIITSKIFLGFSGKLVNDYTRTSLLKLINYTSVIVTTPCAIVKELRKYNIDLKTFINNLASDEKESTPSKFLFLLGKYIDNEMSFLTRAYKKGIKVYMPVIEGELASVLIKSDISLDVVEDIIMINNESIGCKFSGALIFGIGMIKHHILNSNLFKNGTDICVIVNSAVEYDGSDAGALLDEGVSWGKIGFSNKGVKIFCDPSLVFNTLVEEIDE